MVCGLSSPGSPPRSATAPLRVPASSLRSEPRLLTARTLRGSVLPASKSPLSPPPSSPALPPRRGLVPSGTRRAWCVGSPLRGLRLVRPPLRYRVPASSLRSEPRLLTARTLRGSVPPACVARTVASTTVPADYLSLSPPDGVDAIGPRRGGRTESPVRSGTPPPATRQRGRGSVTRRPGKSPHHPLGRAAEHARSAVRVSQANLAWVLFQILRMI